MIAILACIQAPQPVVKFSVDGERWTVTAPTYKQATANDQAAVEIRSTHGVWRLRDLGWTCTCRLLQWPFPGPLLSVRFQSAAGHGATTYYFTARKRKLVKVFENEAEAGGPEFWYHHPTRMVFDNYDYYNHWDKRGSPTQFLVYEVLPSGRAKLRRIIANPKNRRLSSPLGF